MLLLLAAFNDAFGIITNKIALSKAKVPVVLFTAVEFFFLTGLSALTLPYLGWIQPAAFEPLNLILFGSMLGLAVIWNLLYYRSIQKETVQILEMYLLLLPLLTVVISAIFFASERHPQTLIASIIASIVLIASHIKKRTVTFDRWEWLLLIGVILMAAESLLIKMLVSVWSPAALYTARTLGVFLVVMCVGQPTIASIKPPVMALIILSAISGVIYKIIQFTSYADHGIVFTTLVLILSPVFVLLLDKIVLKERVQWRQIVAMLVIIGAVVYGTMTR